jgi:hypothetical protein
MKTLEYRSTTNTGVVIDVNFNTDEAGLVTIALLSCSCLLLLILVVYVILALRILHSEKGKGFTDAAKRKLLLKWLIVGIVCFCTVAVLLGRNAGYYIIDERRDAYNEANEIPVDLLPPSPPQSGVAFIVGRLLPTLVFSLMLVYFVLASVHVGQGEDHEDYKSSLMEPLLQEDGGVPLAYDV